MWFAGQCADGRRRKERATAPAPSITSQLALPGGGYEKGKNSDVQEPVGVKIPLA